LALEKHQANIGAMTADERREAIVRPAEMNGWDFQPGLVDLILQDVGEEPGALPLLSHALLETWKRRQGRTMTLQGYHDAGGVKKAITQTADNVYDHLSPEEQAIAGAIFLRLTELGEGMQDTRRRVKMEELTETKEQEAVAKVLKTLTDARLVTAQQDSVEVAHEALIREWGKLRKWLDEDRESLRLHRHLTESATEWQRRGREPSELYRGVRLRQTQEWRKEHSDQLNPLEREFLRASQNVKSQEIMRLVTFAGVLLLAAVLAQMGYLNRFMYRPIDMDEYWVVIPAGEFQIGSENVRDEEKPVHTVYVDSFEMGRFEVPNRQYSQCVKARICRAVPDAGQGKELHPVVNVDWYDANTFCEWVGGRLPTEAEWEKAASWDAETKTKFVYPWGNDEPTSALLNYYENVGDATPVGTYPAGISPYGMLDMAGNVWEWVSSLNMPYPYDADDGREDMNSSGQRILRGGSWNSIDMGILSAYRFNNYPTDSFINMGFRCARSM
jgi:formylglycine-generating enzyme required for sulfatase activity